MRRPNTYDEREIEKARQRQQPEPTCCPVCKGELKVGSGMVGEDILYCPDAECKGGIVWEDIVGAIRSVL